jgi:hypothetical protein
MGSCASWWEQDRHRLPGFLEKKIKYKEVKKRKAVPVTGLGDP